MAEIKEIGKDISKSANKFIDNLTKKFKEKPVFYTALIVVVIFAVYKLFSSNEETVTDAYVPVGYDGYPELSDSMLEDYESMLNGGGSGGGLVGGDTSSGAVNGEGSSNVEDSYIWDSGYDKEYVSELEKQNEALLSQMWELEQQTLANTLDFTNEGEVYDGLGNLVFSETKPYKVLTGDGNAAQTQQALEKSSNLSWRNSVLQQMQANSAAYSKATTQEQKDALHKANAQLAKGLGLTYNSKTGKWYEADGSEALIYSNTSSPVSSSTKSTTSGGSSYGGVAYDKNTDYAALINKAKSSGASKSEISKLEAQRAAKIAGENLNADGTKKSSSTSVSYDKNVDYAQKIKDAKASGASQSTIKKLEAQRAAKIKGENLNADGTKKK